MSESKPSLLEPPLKKFKHEHSDTRESIKSFEDDDKELDTKDAISLKSESSDTGIASANPVMTSEQSLIINYSNQLSPSEESRSGSIVRVVAGAGTGKTTTLINLAKRLSKQGHCVLYLVYNKAAHVDAQIKFNGITNVHCSTMHSAALGFVGNELQTQIKDDYDLRAKIQKTYENEIIAWLLSNSPIAQDAHGTSNRKVFNGLVALVVFWIFKTLETWFRGDTTLKKLKSDPFCTYYPAKLNHVKKLGFEIPRKFYIEKAADVWEQMWAGFSSYKYPITHDAYLKRAQLSGVQLKRYTAVLVDESQDTNSEQLDLFVKQQARPAKGTAKVVFVVGDAVQTIYSFRGARSKYLNTLPDPIQDFKLTRSFRFGPNIARIANFFLFYKENSPQRNDFLPYRLVGAGPTEGEILPCGSKFGTAYPFTIVARTNLTLILRSLELLAHDPSVKIRLNGGAEGKFDTTVNFVLDVYRLWSGGNAQLQQNKRFDSYAEFKQYTKDFEVTTNHTAIILIEEWKEDLPEHINRFREQVSEKKYSEKEADVILTSVHQAKGLEWDQVEVSDDFIDLGIKARNENDTMNDSFGDASKQLAVNEKVEFNVTSFGDDVNLWYVAVTRAKKRLILPQKYWNIVMFMQAVLEYDSSQGHSNKDLKAYVENEMKKQNLGLSSIKAAKELFQKYVDESKSNCI
jgi:F-box protein 18 (helicase)